MTRHQRDLHRLLQHVAEQANASLAEIRHTGGGHIRATFSRGGPVFISGTPSDRRSIRNVRAAHARPVLAMRQ